VVITHIFEGFTAVGTVAVAVAAIWGNWIRSKLDPLNLRIVLPDRIEDPTTFSGPPGAPATKVMFYHLRVINQRRWLSAENCRIMLVGLSRRDPSNIFQPIPMPVPFQFVWAPAESTPSDVTITREQVLDLGYIPENGDRFIPRLYVFPNNFQGFVGANEAVRFQLQIEAVGFSSPIYVLEVAWGGQWSYNPETMRRHLPIRLNPT
jgi:hypothetical protein